MCRLRCGGCYFSLAVCPASLWWLLLLSGCLPASLWWLLLQSVCVSGFVVVAATSVWLCVRLRCGGCYFSLAMCQASLWWLLLQSGCVSGFVVVAVTSVWPCVRLCCGELIYILECVLQYHLSSFSVVHRTIMLLFLLNYDLCTYRKIAWVLLIVERGRQY